MTVYFNPKRRKWCFDFWRRGVRYTGYCVNDRGEDCTSQRAAAEAEGVEKRKVTTAPKIPSAAGLTIGRCFAALTPAWELKPCWSNRKRWVKEIVQFYGVGVLVADFDEAEVERYRSHCITRPVLTWAGGPHRDSGDEANAHLWKDSGRKRGPNTANLYLGVFRQALVHAGKVRDPVTREPALPRVPAVADFPIAKRKARPIPDYVLSEILPSLPQHAVEAATLTLFFGFRRTEVFELQIANVDFDAGGLRLFAEDVKDNEDEFLPGSPEAMAYLQMLADQARGRGMRHLVTWRPYRKDAAEQDKIAYRPLKKSKGAWTRVMDEVEAKHGRRWRWHDMRASFITHVARTSGQLAAQALARHSDYDTTKAYVEVADEFTRQAAGRAAQRPALAVIHGGRKMGESQTKPISNPKRRKTII